MANNSQSIEQLSIQITATATDALKSISSLTNGLNRLNDALGGIDTSSLNKLRTSLTGANSGLSRFSSGSTNSLKSIKGLSSGFSSFKNILGSVQKAFSSLTGINSIGDIFKTAIEASSDLTEVENVVDRTFGNLESKVEEMASTSITDFGMSELTTKTISSRYQAMALSMGLTASQVQSATDTLTNFGVKIGSTGDSVADMSLNMTKLAADLASFYNTDVDEAAEKLNAVFTGQTRPLRDYGLDLTQATLKEWALKNGLDADVASMSQAEKTMLRYQYVLANTSFLHGDFADTSQTWANQTKILKQQFEALAIVIGQGMIQAIKPFVQALNTALASTITFAKSVLNALGKIFGWEVEDTTSGQTLSDSLDDAADSAASISDGTGGTASGLSDANKNAKDLAKTLLGIDELNLNMPDTASSSSGSGGSGSGSGGSGSGGGTGGSAVASAGLALKKTQSVFESGINSLYALGDYIGKTLSKTLENIDWESIYEKARNFGKGLADYLNGVISPETFATVARTIASALNTALYALQSFVMEFDWIGLGNSIAAGINTFFATFDFAAAGLTVSTLAIGILNMILEAVDNTDWYLIGQKIGTFLANIDWQTALKKAAQILWDSFNGVIDALKGMFDVAPFESAVLSIIAAVKLFSSKGFASVVDTVTTSVSGIKGAFKTLTTAFGEVKAGFDLKLVATGFKDGIEVIRKQLSTTQKAALGVTGAIAGIWGTASSVKKLVTQTGNLGSNIAGLAGSIGIAAAAFSAVFEFPIGLIATAITGIIGLIKGVNEAFEEIRTEAFTNAITDAVSTGNLAIEDFTNNVTGSISEISSSFGDVSSALDTISGNQEEVDTLVYQIGGIQEAFASGALSAEEYESKIEEAMSDLSSTVIATMRITEQTVLGFFKEDGYLGQAFNQLGYSMEEGAVAYAQTVETGIAKIDEAQQNVINAAKDYGVDSEEYKAAIAEFVSVSSEGMDEASAAVEENINKINSSVNSLDFSSMITDGALDESEFSSMLSGLSDTYSAGLDDIRENYQYLINEFSKQYEEALKNGDEVTAEKMKQNIQAAVLASNNASADMDNALKNYILTIQTGLVDKIGEVVQNAGEEWEGLSAAQRNGMTKEHWIQDALTDYQNNVIKPAENGLKEQFGELAENTGYSAENVAKAISEKIFTTEPNYYNGYSTVLADNWQEILTNTQNTATATAQQTGANLSASVIAGWDNGFENVTDYDSMLDWLNGGAIRAHDASKWQFGSPSQYAEELGGDVVEGFNIGIDDASGSTETYVTKWLNSAAEGITLSGWKKKLNEWFNTSVKPFFTLSKWTQLVTPIKTSIITVLNQATGNGMNTLNNWWNRSISPFFSQKRWTDGMQGIVSAFDGVFTSAGRTAINIMNRVISAINSSMTILWQEFSIDGKRVVNAGSARLASIQTISGFKYGGYPDKASLFWAGENGTPELMGTVGGRTAVASGNEITGIRDAVNNQSTAEQALLTTCINLLQTIAGKNTSITIDGREITKVVNDRNRRNGYSFTG